VGSSSSQTIGYRYFFGIHMGLCRGPVDQLVAIKVGDRVAWTGNITGNASFKIAEPELFGGDKGEGGIVGWVDVMMGGSAQAVNTDLAAMLGGTVPAFRGVASLFYDGQISSFNPYPKPWAVRVRRATAGWDGTVWNSADAVISLESNAIRAMNPAHIVYEVLTNRDWGRGLSSSHLDLDAFGTAADTFLAEGLGLCLRWTRTDSIENFLMSVLDHAGAALYPDRTTGLLKLVPIRGGYDPDALPLFTRDTGLLSVLDDDNASQTVAVNEVIVRYRRPQDNKDGQVRAQNLASIHAIGKISTSVDYPGLPTAALAARVAQRELRSGSGFIKRFKLRFDRRGYGIAPASLFRISDPTRGIANMVLRAGRIEEGATGDGAITITALQDVFGLGATAYVGAQDNQWTPPNTTPTAVATRRLLELNYRELARTVDPANLSGLAVTAGYLGIVALKPTSLSLSYTLLARVGGSGDYTERTPDGAFTPTGLLSGDLSVTGTSATVVSATDLALVEVGTAAVIDDEVIRVDSIDVDTGAITFGRGCADTVPKPHAAGSRIWFFENYAGADSTEYTSGSAIWARLLTNTSTGQLAEGSAGSDSLTMAQRQYRPYPPGNLTVNTEDYPAAITGDLALTWSHRDRLTQADQLVDTDEGDIGPEAGVTYTVRIYDGVTLERTYSGISGTSQTYSNTDELADGGPFDPIRFTVHAVRDGLESAQGLEWEVERT
jgi:hypothetical protein